MAVSKVWVKSERLGRRLAHNQDEIAQRIDLDFLHLIQRSSVYRFLRTRAIRLDIAKSRNEPIALLHF
jgi:hypothetical protein